MRVVLIQDDTEVRDKLIFMIESGFGAVVQAFSSLDELKARPVTEKVDLFILDSSTGLSPQVSELEALAPGAAYIQIIDSAAAAAPAKPVAAAKPKTLRPVRPARPTAAAAAAPAGATKEAKIPFTTQVKIERKELTEKLTPTLDEMIDHGFIHETMAPESRCRIRTKLLLSVSPLKGDIYIRLSETKYVKLFQQGDVFDRADLEKYTEKKGVEYLYIRKDDCALFAKKYREDLEKLLKQPVINTEQAVQSAESVHEAVQALAKTVGFTAEVQDLVKTQVKVAMKAISASPRLSELFGKLKAVQGKYLSTHSHLTAYLACAVASQMKWGSEQTFMKLNLACFLHDITLSNHELAAETSLKAVEANTAKYTAQEIRAYKGHAREAANLASRFSEVPPDVDAIIAQHHELPDGKGFPLALNHTRIAPLSAIFIVAHDMAQFTIENQYMFDLNRFLAKMGEKYVGSQFKKILTTLQAMQDLKGSGASGPPAAAA
jgi:HD-GYP domain-containing protein (c-di-GMP phosphodiesterase class II)